MAELHIRRATAEDLAGIEQLLPRLADFPAPRRLSRDDVWRYDALVAKEWAQGTRPQTWAQVAVDGLNQIVGVAFGTLMTDSFTDAVSVHLEIVAIAESVDGQGLGRSLMAAIEADGISQGATVMTLNVMTANERARSVYERLGFDEEMIRAAKPIGG